MVQLPAYQDHHEFYLYIQYYEFKCQQGIMNQLKLQIYLYQRVDPYVCFQQKLRLRYLQNHFPRLLLVLDQIYLLKILMIFDLIIISNLLFILFEYLKLCFEELHCYELLGHLHQDLIKNYHSFYCLELSTFFLFRNLYLQVVNLIILYYQLQT